MEMMASDFVRFGSARVCECLKCPLARSGQPHWMASVADSKAAGWTGCQRCCSSGTRFRHGVFVPCRLCEGRGIVRDDSSVFKPMQTPVVGIIGGGISGMALALALQHRNIPCIIFEKDVSFDSRCQGYGLTMQQGGRVLQKLGIDDFEQYGATTIKHVSFLPDGTVLGSYGDRREQASKRQKISNGSKKVTGKKKKRFNVMLPRQKLRWIVYEKLEKNVIKWGHKFVQYEVLASKKIRVTFECNDHESRHYDKTTKKPYSYDVDLLVGADGIWSKVRKQSLEVSKYSNPRYLGVMVILGRAKTQHELGKFIFQTMDGKTRIYAMPFTSDGVMMWQLSFPISLEDAMKLNAAGPVALLEEARRRCVRWHAPIDQLMKDTRSEDVTGYPTFDRPPPEVTDLKYLKSGSVVLIGDSTHPMSPFKGQGANQALIDGYELAVSLSKNTSLNASVDEFWPNMVKRVRSKVNGSAKAAQILHSKEALVAGDVTRATAHKSQK